MQADHNYGSQEAAVDDGEVGREDLKLVLGKEVALVVAERHKGKEFENNQVLAAAGAGMGLEDVLYWTGAQRLFAVGSLFFESDGIGQPQDNYNHPYFCHPEN